MPPSIRIENVSKLYRLGEVGTGTLSHDLHRAWARLRGKPDPFAKVGQLNDRTVASASSSPPSTSPLAPSPSFLSRLSPLATRRSAAAADYVWALKDINLEIQQGEIVGIIGRNGAGKSTLLKLLSRITEPTTGWIRTKGRIASLLEVGTGFHPELTGRENIYLNGSILGMRRYEINKHLDKIVDFSGCAKYIDTPVKRYSSGMMVRLGFAVAAHLECEILVVDEVLAVGDLEFQQKCIQRMGEVATLGRTVIVVSHNMASVLALSEKAACLEAGGIACYGNATEVVNWYRSRHSNIDHNFDANRINSRSGDLSARFVDVRVIPYTPKTSESCTFEFDISRALGERKSLFADIAISFQTLDGTPLLQLYSRNQIPAFFVSESVTTVKAHMANFPLAPGHYIVNLWLGAGEVALDWIEGAMKLQVDAKVNPNGTYFHQTGYPVVATASWENGGEKVTCSV